MFGSGCRQKGRPLHDLRLRSSDCSLTPSTSRQSLTFAKRGLTANRARARRSDVCRDDDFVKVNQLIVLDEALGVRYTACQDILTRFKPSSFMGVNRLAYPKSARSSSFSPPPLAALKLWAFSYCRTGALPQLAVHRVPSRNSINSF